MSVETNIEALLEKDGFLCACGKSHYAKVRDVLIDFNALEKIPSLLEKYGAKKVFVYFDANTYQAAGEKVLSILSAAGIAYRNYCFPAERFEPDEKSVGSAIMHFDPSCDMIVTVGTGCLNDIGKIVATEVQQDGRITAYGHETLGLSLVEQQLRRITNHEKLIKYVCNQAELHMRPNMLFFAQSKKKKTRQLFDLSVCPNDLILLSRADASGKLDEPYREENETWLRERLEDYHERLKVPMVTGKDLIEAGLKPDKNFSQLIRRARMLHFSGIERKNALRQVLAEAQNMQENLQ